MEYAQDDCPVPLTAEEQWKTQYWTNGYVPNEEVMVKSLLEVASSQRDRYMEGNDTLHRAIQARNEEIHQLKQELNDIKLQKPFLENQLLGNQLYVQDPDMDNGDVVEAMVTYGVHFSNWVRYTLNAFRAFIPV